MSEAAVPLPGLPGPPPTAPPSARRRADLALVVAAFFFGTTFLVVQDAVEDADPVPFLAVRFLIAGAVLAVLGRGRAATPRFQAAPALLTFRAWLSHPRCADWACAA